MQGQLVGHRIVVTGAMGGLGAATIRAVVAQGAKVCALDIVPEAEAGRILGSSISYRACDIARRTEVESAFDWACAEMGGIDGLANAAGIERSGPAAAIDDDHWLSIMAVNAGGTMLTNQAAFRFMRDHGGSIVNFGSIAGVLGQNGSAAYSASKGAVLAWSRAAAREWGKHRITVNCVAPIIWSPMYESFRANMSQEELQARDAVRAATVALGSGFGDADRDFAPVMVFLMSDAARFITGQTLPVDGGTMMLS